MNIDTHALIKILEKAHFKEEQAEAIVDVITRTQIRSEEKLENAQQQSSKAINVSEITKEKLEGVATKEFVKKEIKEGVEPLATKEFVRAEIATVRTEIKSQYIKFTGLVFTMIIALKILTPYFDKFL
jgi:hypothetical protein